MFWVIQRLTSILINFNREEAFHSNTGTRSTLENRDSGFQNAAPSHFSEGFVKAKNTKLQFALVQQKQSSLQNQKQP